MVASTKNKHLAEWLQSGASLFKRGQPPPLREVGVQRNSRNAQLLHEEAQQMAPSAGRCEYHDAPALQLSLLVWRDTAGAF